MLNLYRFSKATKDNFLTGEHIELFKKKPLGSVRGVHTIELFDAKTGKLVERTKSENFISKVMGEVVRTAAVYAFIASNSNNNYGINWPRNLGSGVNGIQDPTVIFPTVVQGYGDLPFRYVLLTDCTEAESPNTETLVRGNIIGWAYRDNTVGQSGTTQGVLNSSESYGEAGHIHLVFDWPTNAGNGTFQSICFNNTNSNNPTYKLQRKVLNFTLPDGYVSRSAGNYFSAPLLFKNGKVYFIAVNSSNSNLAVLQYSFDKEAKTLTYDKVYCEIASGNLPWNADNYQADIANNGDLYLLSIRRNASVTTQLRVYDSTGTPKSIPGVSVSGLNYSTSNGGGGLAINGNDLYLANYANSVYTVSHYNTYDLSTVLDQKTLNTESLAGLQYLPEEDALWNPFGSFYDRPTLGRSEKTPIPSSFDISGSASLYGQVGLFKDSAGLLWELFIGRTSAGGANMYAEFSQPGCMGSRNLLPSPVTKTSTNTMKLQYDLYFDSY